MVLVHLVKGPKTSALTSPSGWWLQPPWKNERHGNVKQCSKPPTSLDFYGCSLLNHSFSHPYTGFPRPSVELPCPVLHWCAAPRARVPRPHPPRRRQTPPILGISWVKMELNPSMGCKTIGIYHDISIYEGVYLYCMYGYMYGYRLVAASGFSVSSMAALLNCLSPRLIFLRIPYTAVLSFSEVIFGRTRLEKIEGPAGLPRCRLPLALGILGLAVSKTGALPRSSATVFALCLPLWPPKSWRRAWRSLVPLPLQSNNHKGTPLYVKNKHLTDE